MREDNSFPSWITKAIVVTFITVIIGGGAAWMTKVSSDASTAKTAIEVVGSKQVDDRKHYDESITRLEGKFDDLNAFIRERSGNKYSYKPRVIYVPIKADGTMTYGTDEVLNGTPSKPKENL